MSDQGERGVRWTDMSESEPRDASRPDSRPGDGPQMAFPEPKVPEGLVPPPAGRLESPGSGEGAGTHDVWGKVEEPRAEDVRVAPASEEETPAWEGDLFDEGAGDERYTPAVPTGAGEPGKPGKPSSGNWQMPAWMADEEAADAKLGGSPKPSRDVLDDGRGRSRLVLFGGVGLLVVALVAAGAVYLMKNGGDASAEPGGNAGRTAAEQPGAPEAKLPPDKRLTVFAGRPSRVSGQVADTHSGLAYPRMAPPWKVPTKQNKLGTPGWSGQQILVTENSGGQLWYGQLLTGTLHPSMQGAYQGPDSVKSAAAVVAQGYEAQYYAFPHKTAPLASQALNVDGRSGWMIASYLTYQRDGVKATGEVVATAVIDTGRKTPAVVFASLPNTHKKMWPDLTTFFSRLKIAS
ncbi:hypothetical protein E1281_22160 [Actinomadura sp. KC345]|uniref:hypothetical protein n=1 Tax=Actinomadura sp. KC345 TaxID=2530371 RepID=UPI00104FB684|nr:hypothetical protein [Actinomadura sp. KC345]TDC50264.1 hypothetical protein E1281_22160 [Actinomadura sp. KC345]